MTRVVVFLPLLAACGRNFDSIEDACKDNVRGDSHATAEAVEIVQRISCYRKFAGIDRGNIDKRVTEAVESHGFYLSENDVNVLVEDWSAEDPNGVGYTGADPFTRLSASGYLPPDTAQVFIWQVLGYVEPDVSLADQVDEEMHDPFYRDVYLSPSWEAAGYTQFSSMDAILSYMNIVLYYPSGARTGNPVSYPIDGQTNVPTTWPNEYAAFDPLLSTVSPLAGYPISFTCGSSDTVGGDNPLAVGVVSSVITGPGGPVEHDVFLPGLYAIGPNNSTAALVPREPYEPDTTYTVDVTLAWIDHEKDISLSFTTGAEAAVTPMARASRTIRPR